MKIAFYAPMKAPDHRMPSGDREIGRALVRVLRLGGHDVAVASRLRTLDRHGDADVQARHRAQGARIAARLAARHAVGARPDAWFTYHVHHKAPDCIGPIVSRALAIPYIVAEASLSTKHADGPWALGYRVALDAIRAADAVVSLNAADLPGLRRERGERGNDVLLPPFVDAARFSPRAVPRAEGDVVRLVTVAMMRERAKLPSYRLLAQALMQLRDVPFSLAIVGDGPARGDVEASFAALRDRVTFLGARASPDIAAVLRDNDVFVWPAIDEAIGIACLEAQACALPVVAGASPGVAGVVEHDASGLLVPCGDAAAFAAATHRLIVDAALRARMGASARARVLARHDLRVAARALDGLLRDVVSARTRAPQRRRPRPVPALP